jgi:hypothetical protein
MGVTMTLSFLDRFRTTATPTLPPVFDGLAQVRAYWEALRSMETLPARAALDPRGLGGVLDRVILAERIGRGLAQVRIAGSGLVEQAGIDLRGLPLSCLFAAQSRPMLGDCIESVFAQTALVELDLGSDRDRIGQLAARLILLPLADDTAGPQLLGAVSFAGKPITGKFQILSRRAERLSLPEPTPTIAPAPSPSGRRYGHLTLVDFNA